MTDHSLTVHVQRCGEKFIWELRRDRLPQAIKYSVPIYLSVNEAKNAGENARAIYIARIAAKTELRLRAKPQREVRTSGAKKNSGQFYTDSPSG
jgi:hypothetical protein